MAQMTMDLRKLVNLICLLLTIVFHISRGQSLEWRQKVQTGLLDALARDGRATFIVCLSQKADLSSAYAIQDWEQRGRYVYEKLTTTARESQKHVLSQLEAFKQSGELSEFNTFWIKNAIGVTSGTESVVASLALRSDIQYIRLPVDMEIFKASPPPKYASTATIEWNISLIEANLAWSNLDRRGDGSIVGLIDTGVDFDHPALVNQYRGNLGNGNFDHNYNWYDPSGTYVSPTDPHGHGTHVIGIAVGDDGQGNQIGVAPLAKWIAARTTFSEQNTTRCLEFMVAPTDVNGNNPDPAKRPHVLNNSWGSCTFSDVFRDEVSALRAAGIVPIFAAGNTTNCGYPSAFCGSIATPATFKESFAVGATTSTGAIANFSLWGPSVDPTDQNAIKPNLSAPGENIRSSVPGGAYQLMSGTSMAAPHVAGTIAILLSAQPSLVGQVDKIQSQLLMTPNGTAQATNCGNEGQGNIPNNAHGEGRVNAYSAARFLYVPQVYSTIASAVSVATSGQTVIVAAGSYTISSNLTIASGLTMTVSQGTTLSFAAGTGLTVNGKLTANGTSTQHISFTKSSTGDWNGITLNSANNSSLQYCNINYANAPLTANSTSSLTISNCKVQFSNFSGADAAVRFYGSSPTITGLTINGQPGSTNGVRFAEGSTGSISNSTIQNCGAGNGIVVQGTSSPLLEGNSMYNNYFHGIVLPGGSGTVVLDNNITTNSAGSYHGITVVGASANLKNNVSTDNTAGLYLENGAYIWSEVDVPNISNWFINNAYGIILYTNSFADLGHVDGSFMYGTCNRIETNSLYNVYMDGTSNLQAMGNSWNPIPPEKTLVGSGGTFNYACRVQSWLDCSQTVCGGASPRMVSSSGSQTEDRDQIFREANLAIAQRDYLRAEELYAYLLTSANITIERLEALKGLHRVFYRSNNGGIINRVLPYSAGNDDAGILASEILMAMYAGTGQYENAITVGTRLKAAFPNTPVEERALVRLAGLAGYDSNYRQVTNAAIQELQSRFGETVDKALLVALGGSKPESSPQASQEAATVHEEMSLSSYPNPFNPSTNFEFRIAERGFVSLKIYDLLGREVAVLVNEEKHPGAHSIVWNAGAMPSGVYFSRLESNGKSVIKQLLLIR